MPGGVRCIVLLPDSRHAEVRQLTKTICIEDDVLRSNVAVNNPVVVQELSGQDEATDDKLCLFLGERCAMTQLHRGRGPIIQVVTQVSAAQVLVDQVAVVGVVEGVLQVKDVRVNEA